MIRKKFNMIYLTMLMILVMEYVTQVDSQCNLGMIKTCFRKMKPLRSRFALVKLRGEVVLCDTITDGGGWIVFQRRVSRPGVFTSFNQNWQKYKSGFGHLCFDYWFGLENLYNVTNRPNHRYQLRIFIKTAPRNYEAIYNNFRLDSEMNNYRLNLGEFTGNISNDFAFHNGSEFATLDRDTEFHCACYFKVGWWFNNCFNVNLNGKMGTVYPVSGAHWDGLTNQNISMTYIEMSFRPMI